MDYFKILNLKKEPFSNSPEPEFFFHSVKHVGCLQKIELTVRLRRGLSVVIGDVGTGKTTLCRQLIINFSSREEDAQQIETHLLMDPSFTTPREFLSTVALLFGIPGGVNGESDWQIKENIKKYLYMRGVDEGKIVVLIIDEGQKLPDFCLEILREFLNYETNEFKLLQIVIFAQKEFEETLKRLKNFADRVNTYYFLEPLNFRETRGMVRFRMQKASESEKAPPIFTFFGLLALYLSTRGYPRKIVTLCHQIILTLIIQNRARAGWFLVRTCARRPELREPLKVRWGTIGSLAIVSAAVLWVSFYPDVLFKKIEGMNPSGEHGVQKITPAAPAVPNVREVNTKTLTEAVAKTPVVAVAHYHKMPEIIGKVRLKEGRTVWRLLSDFYGDFDGAKLREVSRANPHIKNLNKVFAGQVIKLPALQVDSNPLPVGKYLVQISRGTDAEEMYERFRHYETEQRNILFVPFWRSTEGMVFMIILKDGFENKETALTAVKTLPTALIKTARVIERMNDDVVFFTHKK